MNPHKPSEDEIFERASQLSDEQRSAYLKEVVQGDEQLRQRIEALLEAQEQAGDFLKAPLAGVSSKTLVITTNMIPATEKPGDKIGRYKLREQIGEGGCGVVYVADQEEPVRRRVALKVIKLGMDTKQVVARFEAERQALALMDHPNIAKVLDAGATDTGRPYFVMELVDGIKITEYCDKNILSTEARLKLFIQVCSAIQHAHQKGVIHRDIKPSNILVTLHDGVPVPKVIDFGIAKATSGQQLTDKTIYTAFAQFIGTYAYVSPEQAEMSGLGIDTRADIYSLGVLLYELLTGRTPFDAATLQKAGLDQMRKIIREQEPPRPSTCLSTLKCADIKAVANQRGAEPLRLINIIRRDLDWIVMKALEKDRTRRYDTANGFGLDVQRYLDSEPVLACPPSRIYKFQKLVRRNTFAVAAVCVVALVVVVGFATSTWLFIKERAARERAVAAEELQTKLRQESDAARSNAVAMQTVAVQQRERAELESSNAISMKVLADRERERAENEATNALRMRLIAEQQSRNSEARRLLTEANHVIADQPQLGLLLLAEGMNVHMNSRERPLLAVQQALVSALTNLSGFALGSDAPVGCIATSPDARWLASGDWYGGITLWDLDSREPQQNARRLSGHKSGVSTLAISPNGHWLASAAWDGTLGLWELGTDSLPTRTNAVECHSAGVNSIVISKHSRWLATASDDGTSTVWDLKAADVLLTKRIREFHHGAINALGITTNEQWLIVGSEDGTLGISSLVVSNANAMATLYRGHQRPINAISIGPDDLHLATASEDGTASVWLMDTNGNATPVERFEGHDGGINTVLFTSDGKKLVTGGFDGTVRIWDLQIETKRKPPEVLHAHQIGWSRANPEGFGTNVIQTKLKPAGLREFATAEKTRQAMDDYRRKVTSLATFLEQSLPAPQPIRRLSPPTGLHIIAAKDDETSASLIVRDIRAGGVTAMAISSDGRWLITSGSDGMTMRWDLRSIDIAGTGKLLRGHEAWVSAVAVAINDGYVASSSWDGTIRIWGLNDTGRECDSLNLHFTRLDRVIKGIPDLMTDVLDMSQGENLAQDVIDLVHDICARNLSKEEWRKYFPGKTYAKTFPDLPDGLKEDERK
jgi:serine/threonine protein kinase/WD40 repeat protein